MKRLNLILTLLFAILFCNGQSSSISSIEKMYEEEDYKGIIKYKLKKGEEWDAQAYYKIGKAHYFLYNDDKAIVFFDKAIEKGPIHADMYYFKAKTLFELEKYNLALTSYQNAIDSMPDETDFYHGKGATFFEIDQQDSAILYLKKASELEGPQAMSFVMLGILYSDQNKYDLALPAFQRAKDSLDKEGVAYKTAYYNLGLVNYLSNNFEDAQECLKGYCEEFPNDYQAKAKLIQTLYAQKKYDEAQIYREVLYQAYKAKTLPEGSETQFCYDQFMVDGIRVMAFENYASLDKKASLFVKHSFYVMDEDGEYDYKVVSESSIATRMNDGPLYVLCKRKDGAYYTYWNYRFDDDPPYDRLKSEIISIVKQEISPQGSTVPGKK